MEGVPPSADFVLIGFIVFGFALALLITGIQRTVQIVRQKRHRAVKAKS
jgi:hypothetical protein